MFSFVQGKDGPLLNLKYSVGADGEMSTLSALLSLSRGS